MKKYSVRIIPSAFDDIDNLAEFYLDLVDEESSRHFIDDALATIETLADFPESQEYFDKDNNIRAVRVKNHRVKVVYVVHNGIYEVLAFGVFHTSSKPSGYTQDLLERLKELE